MYKVSIITLTYNGLNVLKPCVESVLKYCNDVDFQWIIRENGSSDGSLEYLKTLKDDPRFIIVEAKNDGNFSKMNNDCLPLATGDYLLFLNNDTECATDFLSPMIKILDNDPQASCIGAQLFYPNGHLQHGGIVFDENGMAYNLTNRLINGYYKISDVLSSDRKYQAVTGACMLVRRLEFLKVGMFDEEYHWCYEDVDLALKLTIGQGKYAVVPTQAKMIHKESWSKANPNFFIAKVRLNDKWQDRIKFDIFLYGGKDYNKY